MSGRFRFVQVVTILLFGIASINVGNEFLKAKKNLESIKEQEEINHLVSEMSNIFNLKDNTISDYVILKYYSFTRDFDEYAEQFAQLSSELEPLLKTDKEKRLFREIMTLYQNHHQIFTDELVSAVTHHDEETANRARDDTRLIRRQIVELLEDLRETARENSALSYEEMEAGLANSLQILVISIILAAVLGSILLFLIGRSVRKDLKEVISVAENISGGNLRVADLECGGMERTEIGQLSMAINGMKQNLRGMITHIKNVSDELLKKSEALNHSTSEIRRGGEQISATMEDISKGAEEQANTAQQLLEQMQKFLETIALVVYQSEDTKKMSSAMLSMTNEGDRQMAEALSRMGEIHNKINESLQLVRGLDEKIQNINQLIVVIKDIADQTNLLALNASIEAARAGENGRGFAVVAGEVRKLAEQVNESAVNISSILEGVQGESQKVLAALDEGYRLVGQGSEQLDTTGKTFREMVDIIEKVGGHIETTARALNDVIQQSKPISTAIETIASVSEESAAGVEETAATINQSNRSMENIDASASELKQAAQNLQKVVLNFSLE